MAPPPARSRAIDLLRGVAVGLVILAHLPFSQAGLGGGGEHAPAYPPAPWPEWLAHGHYGVQLFLVISGYCIHIRWARTADLSTRVAFLPFWKRRLMRLYPPYLMVLLACVILTAVGSVSGAVSLDPATLAVDVVLLLLLMQNLSDASIRINNPPFWSLALEEQLYLLYFPLLAMRRRHGWLATGAFVLATNIAWLAAGTVVPESVAPFWYRVGPAYWFAWTLGAIAAEAHCGKLRLPSWTASPIAFAAVLMLGAAFEGPVRDTIITCSFFILIRATIASEIASTALMRSRVAQALVRLGEISYGVYLVHNVAFIVTKRLLVSLGLPMPVILVGRLGAGILAGVVLYLAVEKPALARAQRVPVPLLRSG